MDPCSPTSISSLISKKKGIWVGGEGGGHTSVSADWQQSEGAHHASKCPGKYIRPTLRENSVTVVTTLSRMRRRRLAFLQASEHRQG